LRFGARDRPNSASVSKKLERERKKLAFSSFVSYVQFYAENLEMEGKPENAA
jgi:hypothetical protein